MARGERLHRKLAQSEKAFSKLAQVPELKDRLEEELVYELAAKRFEYTFEVLWKAVRYFLLEEKGLDCHSPMDCFKALYRVGLMEEDLSPLIPRIVRKRNEIVHVYDFEKAADLYEFVVTQVIPVFGRVIQAMKKECLE